MKVDTDPLNSGKLNLEKPETTVRQLNDSGVDQSFDSLCSDSDGSAS